jgi:hypothetical protein
LEAAMATPNLTLTMLGNTGSGKTTFLLGMYNTMTIGVQGYFLYTADPDEGVDLELLWDQLIEQGELPPATLEEQSKRYQFVFNHGFDTLVTVDWLDYRGGAMMGKESAEDTAQLRAQLAASDSIYLVFDGARLKPWLDGKASIEDVRKWLRIGRMTQLLQHATQDRLGKGLPMPSLVVVITKADLLASLEQDREVGDALQTIIDNLETLVPAVYVKGVTTLLCPVQVGNFGTEKTRQVDVNDIDPMGLHRPMIFSLMHRLTEGLKDHEKQLEQQRAGQSSTEQQIAELNQGFRAYLYGRKISRLQDTSRSYSAAIESRERQFQNDQSLIGRLAAELEGHPIIRNGEVEL